MLQASDSERTHIYLNKTTCLSARSLNDLSFSCIQLKVRWKGFANQMCSCFMQCPNIFWIGAVRKSEDHQRSGLKWCTKKYSSSALMLGFPPMYLLCSTSVFVVNTKKFIFTNVNDFCAIEILTWIKSVTLLMSSLFHLFRFWMPVSTVLKSYFADTPAEREAKPADPQMSKLMATEHEDERADHLKRKGRYWSLHLDRIIKSTYRLFYETQNEFFRGVSQFSKSKNWFDCQF